MVLSGSGRSGDSISTCTVRKMPRPERLACVENSDSASSGNPSFIVAWRVMISSAVRTCPTGSTARTFTCGPAVTRTSASASCPVVSRVYEVFTSAKR